MIAVLGCALQFPLYRRELWCGRYSHPLAMCIKLRCIHTLNAGNAITEITGMRYKQGIFENVSAFA